MKNLSSVTYSRYFAGYRYRNLQCERLKPETRPVRKSAGLVILSLTAVVQRCNNPEGAIRESGHLLTPGASNYAQFRPVTTTHTLSCAPRFAGCRDVWGCSCDNDFKRSPDSRFGRVGFQSFVMFRNAVRISLHDNHRVLCISHVPGLGHLTLVDEGTVNDGYQSQSRRCLLPASCSSRFSSITFLL